MNDIHIELFSPEQKVGGSNPLGRTIFWLYAKNGGRGSTGSTRLYALQATPKKLPRWRNLWVTSTLQWRQEARLAQSDNPVWGSAPPGSYCS
jgi:hypothetical protein